ncbi:MAG: NAD(P)-dependent oxidoreductase [bacterium]
MRRTDLVTGGSGLLGLALARRLAGAGRAVRLFDVRRPDALPGGAEFREGDIRDAAAVDAAAGGAERIFHLAALMHVGRIVPRIVREVNIGGLLNVMNAAEKNGVRRVVFTSTIEIYGTEPDYPCYEDSRIDPPPGYALHKWMGEKLLTRFSRRTGTEVAFTRMPMIFGPGFYHFKAVLRLFDAILAGLPIPVLDGGERKGKVVSLEDAVQGLALAGERGEAAGEAFNICCGDVFTHRSFVEGIARAVGSRSRVVSVPSRLVKPAFEAMCRLGLSPVSPEHFHFTLSDCVYDISKAERLLGYTPAKTSVEAAAEALKHYGASRRKYRKKPVTNLLVGK